MDEQAKHRQMNRVLVWTNLLSEPLFTLYTFLLFILYKDLGATPFQIALLTMLKPLVAILSFYWSAGLAGRSSKLKSNVLWAGFLMRAPFLLCPWVDSAWFVIGAAVNYMFFYRAGLPAWLEMIRRNMGAGKGRSFSLSAAVGYAEGVILALAYGSLLDRDPSLWKGMFFSGALLGLLSVLVQSRIAIQEEAVVEERLSWKELLVRPWRDSYELIRSRPDFSQFQWGFMVSGFGLMLLQPAIPLFAVDVLGVSYLEMAAAVSVAKGLGFVASSPLWAKGVDRVNVFKMASLVFFSFALFTVLMSLSLWQITWFYLAYFWYGVGQGGSHLVWNLSGPIFAGKNESSRYTGVNVALVGIRGAFGPAIGGWLSVVFGPIQTLLLGGGLCFYSSIRMFQSKFSKDSLSIKA